MPEEMDVTATPPDTQVAPVVKPDTAPAWVGADIAEDDEVEAPVVAGQVEGEAKPDTAAAAALDKPKTPDTPAFEPAKYGFDESYAHCKTLEEAARLAVTRHKEAARKIAEQGKEIGDRRKAEEEAKAKAEAEKAKPAEPKVWTKEELEAWRGEIQAAWDESPEVVIAKIQEAPMQEVAALKGEIATLKASVKELTDRSATIEHRVDAPVVAQALEAQEKFFKDTPEAVPYRESGKLRGMYDRLNEGRSESNPFPVYEADLFGLVKLQETDPAIFQEVYDLVATGRVRYDKALKFAKGNGEAPKPDGLAARTDARGRAAAGGKGGGVGRPALITSGDIADEDEDEA